MDSDSSSPQQSEGGGGWSPNSNLSVGSPNSRDDSPISEAASSGSQRLSPEEDKLNTGNIEDKYIVENGVEEPYSSLDEGSKGSAYSSPVQLVDQEEDSGDGLLVVGEDSDVDEVKEDGGVSKADDLFGGDISASSEDESRGEARPAEEREVPEERDIFGEVSDDDEEVSRPVVDDIDEDVQEDVRIEVEMPKLNTDLGDERYFVKLPNFLSMEKRPFDPNYYDEDIEDESEVLDEEGRSRLKLKVENTIRWRTVLDSEGREARESNARLVRWDDGSMSLHLGNEIFDIHRMGQQGLCSHLFVRQGTGLVGQSVFHSKLNFRPHTTESATHRKMTMKAADKSSRVQRVKVLPMAGANPECNRAELVKQEEERLRATLRRESQRRRIRERQQAKRMTSSYLEADDDGGTSIAAIKRQYKSKQGNITRAADIYSSTESEEEKPTNLYSGSSADGLQSDTDTRKTKRKTKTLVVEDDDDSDL